jgi:AAA+ ATPase superfamily predicted ATPase
MRFYNREKELSDLHRVKEKAFNDYSRLTVVTGRRRIGKTSLILKSCEDSPTVYLFVSRSNEAALCHNFYGIITRTLNTFVPKEGSFARLFEFLLLHGQQHRFNLVIDEFQEFFYINPEIYSLMQDIWDRYRKTSKVNLIVSGSVYTLMHRIFMDAKEPLYGRVDNFIKLKPFGGYILKEILSDYKPDYTNEDLLALYTFTGGVPKYVELLVDNCDLNMPAMVDYMIRDSSPFLTEGNALLIQELGKKYGNYFSILAAIASGKTTSSEIMAAFNNMSIGGLLKRLEEDYEIINKKRPILSKEGAQTVRYELSDHFLRFWFRYIFKYQDYIEANNFTDLQALIKKDYPTYSGLVLESYFKDRMKESQQFRNIGSWWENKNNDNQNEIDIVGIYSKENKALVAEVKRQYKNFKPEQFRLKVEAIRTKLLYKYEIESRCFSMDDM